MSDYIFDEVLPQYIFNNIHHEIQIIQHILLALFL